MPSLLVNVNAGLKHSAMKNVSDAIIAPSQMNNEVVAGHRNAGRKATTNNNASAIKRLIQIEMSILPTIVPRSRLLLREVAEHRNQCLSDTRSHAMSHPTATF